MTALVYCYDPYWLQNCKFFLTLVCLLVLVTIIMSSTTSKERMTTNICICVCSPQHCRQRRTWKVSLQILITAILSWFLVKLGWGNTNSPKLLLLKILPSAYTITGISRPPPLISQLFSHWPFWTELHLFLKPGFFKQIIFIRKKICEVGSKELMLITGRLEEGQVLYQSGIRRDTNTQLNDTLHTLINAQHYIILNIA